MRSKRGVFKIIAILILLIGLATASYFLYLQILDITAKPVEFVKNVTKPSENQSSFSGKFQFYPEMRFAKKDIIYNIGLECSEEKKLRTEQAFTRLEQETNLLKFYENIYEEKADILISCEEMKEPVPGTYFIAGEGGPTIIINSSKFYVIEKGKILLLYKKSECKNYNVELHELLHVFGFDHSSNQGSIMYNTTSCNQQLTQDIIAELKRLYSIEELPDLYFSHVEATKHGSYLDFSVEIRNIGLNIAENARLEIYSKNGEDKKVNEFNLESINYGEGKFFEVKNLRIDRDTKQVKFILVLGLELDKKNNMAELFPS